MQEEEHNLDTETSNGDNLQDQAGNSGKLAGKFQDRESLIDSTAELVRKISGRDLTYNEFKNLRNKKDEELEREYNSLEREFHNRPKTTKLTDEDEEAEILQAFEKYASKLGLVRKEELEAEKYEKNQLESYLSQNPDAENRIDLIKTLAKTNEFKNKSFADVDAFIKKNMGQSGGSSSPRSVKLGQSQTREKNLSDYSDEEFAKLIKPTRGGSLLKK